jgi:hypothetical protein
MVSDYIGFRSRGRRSRRPKGIPRWGRTSEIPQVKVRYQHRYCRQRDHQVILFFAAPSNFIAQAGRASLPAVDILDQAGDFGCMLLDQTRLLHALETAHVILARVYEYAQRVSLDLPGFTICEKDNLFGLHRAIVWPSEVSFNRCRTMLPRARRTVTGNRTAVLLPHFILYPPVLSFVVQSE